MILENCSLFPHCLLPLNIFEPRYRQMLEDALESLAVISTERPDRHVLIGAQVSMLQFAEPRQETRLIARCQRIGKVEENEHLA